MLEEPLPVWELMRTAHVVGQRFTELMSAVGLTPTQLAVLLHLEEHHAATQAELARAVLVSPQGIGALLAPLLEQGLVVRDGPGGRGRRAGLSLTDAGRQVLDRARGPVEAFNSPPALGLTPAQTAMLTETLERIRTTMTNPPHHPATTTPLPASAPDNPPRPSQ